MEHLTLGVVGSSRKEHEQRVPIHPDHLSLISPAQRERLVFESGYGEPFGIRDEDLTRLGVTLASRAELLATSGVVLLPKPVPADLEELPPGSTLWGWPHCVQQRPMTQLAIDRRLTLIAWESMYLWRNGVRDMHLFYRNNELAGYASVIHALARAGLDGHYGAPLTAVVLSLGSAGRGAIRALRGRGVRDIRAYTQRPSFQVHDRVMGCTYGHLIPAGDGFDVVDEDGVPRPLIDVLSEADVLVNAILQDTEHPLMFLEPDEVPRLKPGALVVDVSCDEGMGFPFARPTTFSEPTFPVGAVTYYAVDHSPSYLWRSASWELSRAVLPYLEIVLGGPGAWEREETIARAIDIREGVVQDERILTYQGRAAEYPHA